MALPDRATYPLYQERIDPVGLEGSRDRRGLESDAREALFTASTSPSHVAFTVCKGTSSAATCSTSSSSSPSAGVRRRSQAAEERWPTRRCPACHLVRLPAARRDLRRWPATKNGQAALLLYRTARLVSLSSSRRARLASEDRAIMESLSNHIAVRGGRGRDGRRG